MMRRIFSVRFFSALLLGASAVAGIQAGSAFAETLDFGGLDEKYKGAGDKTPPQCQVSYPSASVEPFFIKWNCSDDIADPLDIESKLWIYVKGEPVGRLLTSFLGFPASVRIDESILKTSTFREGLPVSFRLVASDRGGNSTITPLITIGAQDNTLSTCDIAITAAASQSSGSTTGLPEQKVILNKHAVSVAQPTSSSFQVSSDQQEEASSCQIDSICSNDSEISYSANLAFESGSSGALSGTLTVSPGGLTVDVEGQGSVSDLVLANLQVSGTTTYEGRQTAVTLSCSKN